MKIAIEDSLNTGSLSYTDSKNMINGIGNVDVTCLSCGKSGGFEWVITFVSAIGNIGEVDSSPLLVNNLLSGRGAKIHVATVQNANTIGGVLS